MGRFEIGATSMFRRRLNKLRFYIVFSSLLCLSAVYLEVGKPGELAGARLASPALSPLHRVTEVDPRSESLAASLFIPNFSEPQFSSSAIKTGNTAWNAPKTSMKAKLPPFPQPPKPSSINK